MNDSLRVCLIFHREDARPKFELTAKERICFYSCTSTNNAHINGRPKTLHKHNRSTSFLCAMINYAINAAL